MNVSEINEFLYCKRQWWYHKQGISIDADILKQGRFLHRNNEGIFLKDKKLIGILDRLEGDKIVEIKRTSSDRLWYNHKIQLLTYLFLANQNGFNIKEGIVRYANNKEFIVKFNRKSRKYLQKVISKMESIKSIPNRTENKNKCKFCSIREYCYA